VASDLSVLKKWFKSLNGPDFLVLPAPTRSRYTQSQGREDVAEELAERELPGDTPAVFWHWQSHERAFSRKGELVDELYLHWQGPHATIAARLTGPPAPFTVTSTGPDQAFRVGKPFSLPEPDDRRAVPPALRRLATAVATGGEVTGAERDWLVAVAHRGDDEALDLLFDLGAAPLDLVGVDLDAELRTAWTRLAARSEADRVELARSHPEHPLAAAVLGEPAGPLDTDADDALAVTAARLWQAADVGEAVAAVGPWTEREHTAITLGDVLRLLALRLHPGVHQQVHPARLLDLAADERVPFFWRALAVAEVSVLGGLEHLADRLEQVRTDLDVAPGPFTGAAGPIAGDRARLRALASWNWQLGREPNVLRTDADRTTALACTVGLAVGWFWTWPDELAAFDADGRMIAPLPVHLLDGSPADMATPRFEFRDSAIHPGACPPLEDIVARLGAPHPASFEDLDYLKATFIRYAVQGTSSLHRDRASTLFDVWRTHDGHAGPTELLDTRTVRAMVDEYYVKDGLAASSGYRNGFPFLPFARAGAVVFSLDMRHRVPPVLAGAPGAVPDEEPVAATVDAFLAERL
jgi:hypothetical protein